ncbi:MAG: energy-coupling factor transporter ATPase [Clostridiales bacterium]|nr:energy-coupling factor transporter ATPase [Clostridiales bacterium]
MPIKVENLIHIYNENSPYETIALDHINVEIQDGDFVGIIGHTGSGKSTFIQHLNGLLKPKSGKIYIDDTDITDKKIKAAEIRRKVGLVFQYPEYQLFEETVYKDVAFGPKNLGLEDIEVERRVKDAIQMVGLDYEDIKDKSPFDLSGGQKRRAAIAGVIAMKPQVLILDEPTAGLDPKGHKEILQIIKNMHVKEKNTILLVSHNMGDIAELADKIIVMEKGKIVLTGTPQEVYEKADYIEKIGLGLPPAMMLMRTLKQRGKEVKTNIMTIDEAEEQIINLIRSR